LADEDTEGEQMNNPLLSPEPSFPTSYSKLRSAWMTIPLGYVESMLARYGGLIKRVLSFLFVGGLGAIINILCFTTTYTLLLSLTLALIAYCAAFVLATELSILVNFVLNDRFTFRHLRAVHSSWLGRCLRFHAMSLGGTALTFGISFSLLHFVHILALMAQAIALIVATAFNFVGHHLFTYQYAAGKGRVGGSSLTTAVSHRPAGPSE
jgi:putative flippase GtrA